MAEKSSNKIDRPSIVVNQVPIEWSASRDRFTFFGLEAIIFWKDPSLLSILRPLRDELGEELYSLLVAYEVAKGTYDDYHAMVASLGNNFEEGFINWGRAVSGAGWGSFDLLSIDRASATARVRIDRPWEFALFQAENPLHAIPFLNGKLSGIFSWAFDRHCRATVEDIDASPDGHVTLSVAPSTMTLGRELELVREKRGLSEPEHLHLVNRELREHLNRYFQVVEAAGEFICEMDRQMRIVFTTHRLAETLGYAEESLTGRDFRELLTADGQRILAAWLASREPGTPGELEVGAHTADGSRRWLAIGIDPLVEMRGATTGYRCAGRDVTDAYVAREELRLMAAAFRSSQAVIVTDAEGRIERINEGFRTIWGEAGEEVIGRPLGSLGADPEACGILTGALDTARREGFWEGEVWYRRASAEPCPVWQSVTACRDEHDQLEHLVAVFHGISEQKRLESELEWQATHDHLTGLLTRAPLERYAACEIERARRYQRAFSLLLLDVDHFKHINDDFGHPAGDAVLREIATRLQQALRGSDMVARWGGEEFMLLAPETTSEQALDLAGKLCALMRDEPFLEVGRITASVGVAALCPDDTFHTLFQRVDQALYAAKLAGRDRCRAG